MEPKYNTNSFKKLLDRLQEDSWQLELLISAFAIFGLFYVIDPLTHTLYYSRFYDNEMAARLYESILLSVYVLIFNLVLHVLFRALWIGSLGLRYVSGEIEIDKLNYSEKFTKYLKNKVGSFDGYISKLEDLSSVMFAISFLIIFYVLAFHIVIYGIGNGISNLSSGVSVVWIRTSINIFLTVFYIGALITFIDFITQGLLKKNKWVSMFYFPIYWIFSITTLSFLYRPLVYNFLDNKFGKRVSFILLPFYIMILILSSLYYQTSSIIPLRSTLRSKENIAHGRNYEDIVNKGKNLFIKSFAIQSKVITEPYVKIIIPLTKQIEDPLFGFNPGLKFADIRGYHMPFTFQIGNLWNNMPKDTNNDSIRNVYLNTFEEYYSFKIDTITYKTDFVITNNAGEYIGIEAYIGIKDLHEGKHIIEFQKLKHKDTDSLVSIIKVPFWYYKD